MPSVLKALRKRRIYLKQDLWYIYFYLFPTSFLLAAALISLFINGHVPVMSRYGSHRPDQTEDESEYNPQESVIGFRRKGIEEFLEITLRTRQRRSSMATRATLASVAWRSSQSGRARKRAREKSDGRGLFSRARFLSLPD